MSEQLKPCPFCGGSNLSDRGDNGIKCHRCGAWGPDQDKGKWWWNTRASGWQPIETAPTDGTHILVFAPVDGVVSSYFKHGCWQRMTTVYAAGRDGNEPTHWMPLPDAPEADQ